jgi:hypothetical protein
LKNYIKNLLKIYRSGKRLQNDYFHKQGEELIQLEYSKKTSRTNVINYLLGLKNYNTNYLEIGVRCPKSNFDKIKSKIKYGIDPGYENPSNPVDFKLTSDEFFEQLKSGHILNSSIKFDVIFIDGLHLADQVERDVKNSLDFLKSDGFIVLHDCNPPSFFHTIEHYAYNLSPAKGYWNGTTWKAFFKLRKDPKLFSCCIDSDWGIGIVSKTINIGEPTSIENPYFEFKVFEKHRKECLNLIDFETFIQIVT